MQNESVFPCVRELESLVYFDGALSRWHGDQRPGERLANALDLYMPDSREKSRLQAKLVASCRKLCMVQYAIDRAGPAEQTIYDTSYRDAMAWFGESLVELNFYLEAAVLYARAALDVATPVFSLLMPDPLPRKETDSFNEFTKRIANCDVESAIARRFKSLRNEEEQWFGWLVGYERGRSLRDKLVHQMEFPLDARELHSPSERETLVVRLGEGSLTPSKFFDELLQGICSVFVDCEVQCEKFLQNSQPA